MKTMKPAIFTVVLLVLMLVSPEMGYKLKDQAVQERGQLCTLSDLNKIAEYIFENRSTVNHLVLENAIKDDLSAFTLSFFVKMDPGAAGYQCVFSYATPESPYGNGLYVCLTPTVQIDIANEGERVTKIKIEEGQMHHISVTWENTNGDWQLFVDGQLVDSGEDLMKGHVIPHGGTAVVGQDQDTVGGGFEMRDAFGPGLVGQVNLWDKVLSPTEIGEQSESCSIPYGSVIASYHF